MKRTLWIMTALLSVFCLASARCEAAEKTRLFVVSSYHREYLWSQDTQKGLCAALKDFKFVESDSQLDEFTKNDFLETDTLVIKKVWMDTKRRNGKTEMATASERIAEEIKTFKPDLILLGDDNATRYIGNQFIDASLPVVFWGVNGNPLKYSLVDSIERPGHNITGVYQPGYYKEGLERLKQLYPSLKTLAILSDDSETGRSHEKAIEELIKNGRLPLILVESFRTNSFSEWKTNTLRLAEKVDAFFVVNHSTFKDDSGKPVDQLEAAAWYLTHIHKPEVTPEKQMVQEGLLIAADDSGFKQAYEAVRLADAILHGKKDPSSIPIVAPTRGAIIVNRQRAKALGIDLSEKGVIEETIDTSLALEKYPQ